MPPPDEERAPSLAPLLTEGGEEMEGWEFFEPVDADGGEDGGFEEMEVVSEGDPAAEEGEIPEPVHFLAPPEIAGWPEPMEDGEVLVDLGEGIQVDLDLEGTGWDAAFSESSSAVEEEALVFESPVFPQDEPSTPPSFLSPSSQEAVSPPPLEVEAPDLPFSRSEADVPLGAGLLRTRDASGSAMVLPSLPEDFGDEDEDMMADVAEVEVDSRFVSRVRDPSHPPVGRVQEPPSVVVSRPVVVPGLPSPPSTLTAPPPISVAPSPTTAAGWVTQGQSLLAGKQIEEAIEAFERALILDPMDATAATWAELAMGIHIRNLCPGAGPRKVPLLRASRQSILGDGMDPELGLLLSYVDGMTTCEELESLLPTMPRMTLYRRLGEAVSRHLVAFEQSMGG